MFKHSPTTRLSAVVFPTAQTLKNVKELAKEASRLVLMVNPQWQVAGTYLSCGRAPTRRYSAGSDREGKEGRVQLEGPFRLSFVTR